MSAQEYSRAPEYAAPDDRFKADILLIVAHPDDETGDVAAYLARAVHDQHRRVAVIYTTHGAGGFSAVGNERGIALGAEREIEARSALGSLGITSVWFLNAVDTGSEDVLQALEHMDHGSVLAQTIRLIRLTRPEVIITWLPLPVVGENHADHQGAAVIATEAFDLAGDPVAFAEQVTTTTNASLESGNRRTERLRPWQPKKIYYFSDADDEPGYWSKQDRAPSPFRKNFLDDTGPSYSSTEVSPSQHVSYAQLAAQELSPYLTQDGAVGRSALATGNLQPFQYPTRFVFGKSLVGGGRTADVFAGISGQPLAFPGCASSPARAHGPSVELGGPWAFYREFWQAHGLEQMPRLLPVPELKISAGRPAEVPLLLRNDTDAAREVSLMVTLPAGWSSEPQPTVYPVRGGDTYPVNWTVHVPDTARAGWYEISWKAEAGGRPMGAVHVRVYAQ